MVSKMVRLAFLARMYLAPWRLASAPVSWVSYKFACLCNWYCNRWVVILGQLHFCQFKINVWNTSLVSTCGNLSKRGGNLRIVPIFYFDFELNAELVWWHLFICLGRERGRKIILDFMVNTDQPGQPETCLLNKTKSLFRSSLGSCGEVCCDELHHVV